MNLFELETRLIHYSQCIDALVLLTQRKDVHGLDCALLDEEISELIRARYDELRAFECQIRADVPTSSLPQCDR